MSVPFFGFFLAFAAVLAGKRGAAVIAFALSLAFTLLLFKLHATDPLAISL
ncbi:DUF5993 family protein [Aquabacter cavernae]|uniref:DUF5993 family protein n=1 Tax=Aquabacter cavernae TaxID=2496029 RepID=UPI001FE21F0E|nr:DUF5993 family protein [Aquabacter cavernae]